MKKIIIAIDHKWRDVPGYVYLKKLLEKKGYKVYLTRMQFDSLWAKIHNADALIGIHLYDDSKRKKYEELHNNGTSIFLMPTEGIPTLEGVRKLAAGTYSNLSCVDMHFVWNDYMKGLTEENKTMAGRPVAAVGVPRFDFYRPPLNKLLMSREAFNKKYKVKNNYPVITLATNFTHASFFEKNIEFMKEDWKRLKVDQIYDPEDIARRDFESRNMILNAIRQLLTDFPEANFVIKMHPSENHEFYYKFYTKKELERIRIIRQEYIWDVLNVTDVLLKRSCTTGVEAWFSKLPTIELRLNPEEWYYSPDHAAGSEEVAGYDSLKSRVAYYLNGGEIDRSILNNREEFIAKWCYKVDGKSSERFVNKTDEFLKNKKGAPAQRAALKEKIKYFVLKWTNFWPHDLRVYGLFSRKDKLGRFDKYIHLGDVKEWEKRINEINI